jgi:hypothetical protein
MDPDVQREWQVHLGIMATTEKRVHRAIEFDAKGRL